MNSFRHRLSVKREADKSGERNTSANTRKRNQLRNSISPDIRVFNSRVYNTVENRDLLTHDIKEMYKNHNLACLDHLSHIEQLGGLSQVPGYERRSQFQKHLDAGVKYPPPVNRYANNNNNYKNVLNNDQINEELTSRNRGIYVSPERRSPDARGLSSDPSSYG